MIAASTGLVSRALMQEGKLDAARETLGAVLNQDASLRIITGKYCWAARLELALFEGDPGLALEVEDRLAASMEKGYTSSASAGERLAWQRAPRLLLLRGQALAAANRNEESEATLKLARECSQIHHALGLVWRTRLALGRLYAAQGLQEQARQEFGAARNEILELALNVPDAPLRASFLENAALLFPS